MACLLLSSAADVIVLRLLQLSTVGFSFLRVQRIRRHLQFIERDDELLVQDKLLGHLSEGELNEALEARGM
jgi:LETM1 and EF-hand domain-containing protein 1